MAGIARSISGALARLHPIALVGIAAVVLASCGSSFVWSGQWQGKRSLSLPKGGDPSVLATISRVDLTLKADGTFELLEGGIPKSGTYRTDGRKAYLQVTHFMDRKIEALGDSAVKMNQEIVLSAQKDGSVRFFDPGGIVQETVTLRREDSESQR